jgi:hypothetical protein
MLHPLALESRAEALEFGDEFFAIKVTHSRLLSPAI